jgi:hypothetical protein
VARAVLVKYMTISTAYSVKTGYDDDDDGIKKVKALYIHYICPTFYYSNLNMHE